jgi:hypothetical protein
LPARGRARLAASRTVRIEHGRRPAAVTARYLSAGRLDSDLLFAACDAPDFLLRSSRRT